MNDRKIKLNSPKYILACNVYLIFFILRDILHMSAEEAYGIIGLDDGKWHDLFTETYSLSANTCKSILEATTAHGLDKKYFDKNGNIEWIINDKDCRSRVERYLRSMWNLVDDTDSEEQFDDDFSIKKDELRLELWKYLASDIGRWIVNYIIKYKGRKDLDISMAEEINDPVFKSVLADVQKFNDTYNNVDSKRAMNKYVKTFVENAYVKSNPTPKRKNKAPLTAQKNSTAVFNKDRMSCFKFNFLMIYYVLFYGELEDSSRINRFFGISDIESYDIDSNKVSLREKLHEVNIRFDDLTKYKYKKGKGKNKSKDEDEDKDPNNTKITLTDKSINYFNGLCKAKNMSDTEIVRRTLDFELYVSDETPRYDFLKLLLLCPLVDKYL